MDAHHRLFDAVCDGRVEEVRQFIYSHGLSSLPKGSEGYDLLREALYKHRIPVAKLLISSGSEVNSKSQKPTDTPLHFAIRTGDVEVVGMLLNRGADVNAKNHCGTTPLHEAAKGQKMEVVELLLEGGANVDAADNTGWRPLHVAAAEMGNSCIVGRLLKNGASVNCEITSSCLKGMTPLHFAVRCGNSEVVALLLSGGAHVDVKEQGGKTPLHIATREGYTRISEQLLNNGASTLSVLLKTVYIFGYEFSEGSTPLHVASGSGKEEVVKLLLNRGADVNASTKDNSTPLHMAIRRGHENVVSLLLEHGAKVDIQDEDGKTALPLAVETGSPVIVKGVLKCCPDVNDERNRSSLETAVLGFRHTHKEIVETLLEYGFTVDSKDANNPELFHASVKKGHLKIVADLLKCGADVDMSKEGFTPLHVAAKNKQEEVAELLLSHKADINAKCKAGRTPVFYAIEEADLKTTRLLLTNGANVENSTELLNVAVKTGCTETVETLLQHGADVNAGDEYGRTPLHFTALEGKERYICSDSFRDFFFSFLVDYRDPDFDIAVGRNNAEIAQLLLSKGANVHAQAKKNGVTTLHAASEKGFAEVVEAVLGHGADVNAKLKDGVTALHIATQNRHLQVVKVLLDYGAKVDSKMMNGLTPLHVGAKRYPEIIEIFLKFGADVDGKDEKGRTALHIASYKGHQKVVETLLEYGADVNITTKRNQTPLELAIAGWYRSHRVPCNRTHHNCGGFLNHRYFKMGDCEETGEVLENHIVKMKTANLYVSQTNLLSLRDSLELHYFQNDCEKEIVTMKSEMMNDTNISVYDILAKPHSLPVYMRNENIVEFFKTGDYKNKFPIYASMIKSNFRNGMERKDLLDRGHAISHFLFGNVPEIIDDFPDECTEKIYSYLSNKDLRILINICEPRPQHQ